MIQDATGAELFSIRTEEPYPDNYDDTVFPNWWGDMPMAVYSFLDEYDLSGKTIAPFVTSGGSGFSGTVSEIETLEPDAEVQEGLSIGDSNVQDARGNVESWLQELGYMK